MADALFDRRCRLTVAIPVVTPGDYTHVTTDVVEIGSTDDSRAGLRVQFKIAKTDAKEPNTSTITVSNLSPTRRASLQVKGVKVTLEAGYAAAGVSRIFRGDARIIDHVRDGADWNTTFRLGDGERAYRNARCNESFAPGTSAGDVLLHLATASGLDRGNVADAAAQLTARFDQGYVVDGPFTKAFDRLVRSFGYTWSIQDGAIQVLAPDGSLAPEVPEVSPQTGLIGSPEFGTPEKPGKPALLKFKSLLFPARPGGRVHVSSARYNGEVVLKKVEFTGDTHGDDWYVEMQGVLHPDATK